MHWCIGSLLHWTIDSLIHRLTESSIHWFIHSLIHWFIDSLAHWFIDAVLVHSLSCARILSCHFIGISTTISTLVDAPHNFNRSGLLHLKSVPIGHWFLIVISYFRNFRPGAGRALSGLGINIILCVYTYYIYTHIIYKYIHILYIYTHIIYIYTYYIYTYNITLYIYILLLLYIYIYVHWSIQSYPIAFSWRKYCSFPMKSRAAKVRWCHSAQRHTTQRCSLERVTPSGPREEAARRRGKMEI